MKVRSIPHIWAIVSGLILLIGPASIIYGLLSQLYSLGKIIPKEDFLPLGIIITLLFWVIQMMIYFVKITEISDDNIRILFPFRLKAYNYKTSELVMHTVYLNYGRFMNYESLHFQTKDNKIFMIMQFEYWNFRKFKEFIVNNSTFGEISKFHNLKFVLIELGISIALTIGMIALFNGIIN
jgi:hypothetical protein